MRWPCVVELPVQPGQGHQVQPDRFFSAWAVLRCFRLLIHNLKQSFKGVHQLMASLQR
jgi:hypothetical protein